jgi:cystathionine beta-lyase/cystathionine gamma-synthase
VVYDYKAMSRGVNKDKIAKKQMKGYSGMVSFEIVGGKKAIESFLRKVKVFSLAESLGGVDSLVEHPATMSHASMPEDFRKKVGITEDLIRLSIGLENIDDLKEDLEQALKRA